MSVARCSVVRFELLRQIGQGGNATVYEAIDRQREKKIALKIANHEEGDDVSAARIEREARAAMALNHPNVCRVRTAGRFDDGRRFVAMELLKGETLRSYLARCAPINIEDAIEIGVQILSGLEAAHDLGIVHRDIKPENIFLAHRDGLAPLVKILDFGICRRRGVIADCGTLTRTGVVVGTPEYMSPEQASGSREVDTRIDLFAVGMVLFEALSATRVHAGLDPAKIIVRILRGSLPSLSSLRGDIPGVLENVIMKAIQRDPNHRHPTARDFMHELLEARTSLRRRQFKRTRVLMTQRMVELNAPTRRVGL